MKCTVGPIMLPTLIKAYLPPPKKEKVRIADSSRYISVLGGSRRNNYFSLVSIKALFSTEEARLNSPKVVSRFNNRYVFVRGIHSLFSASHNEHDELTAITRRAGRVVGSLASVLLDVLIFYMFCHRKGQHLVLPERRFLLFSEFAAVLCRLRSIFVNVLV